MSRAHASRARVGAGGAPAPGGGEPAWRCGTGSLDKGIGLATGTCSAAPAQERAEQAEEGRAGAGDHPDHTDAPGPAGRLVGRALSELQVTLPMLVLHEPALRQNIQAMARYCAARGVSLCPHAKTTMAPEVFLRQLEAGAWGLTAATIDQVRVYRAFGVARVLLANELVDPVGIRWLAAEHARDPGFECLCYVDSLAGVSLLQEVLASCSPPASLGVLVECGHDGGRSGCRSDEEATAVAEAVQQAPALRLAGVAGYEGSLGSEATGEVLRSVANFCGRIHRLAGELVAAGLLTADAIVSAGGSAFFDVVVEELTKPLPAGPRLRVVLRSGSYVLHDDGYYGSVSPFSRGTAASAPTLQPALELRAHVLSRPEEQLALIGAGRRDVSFDAGLPTPKAVVDRQGGRRSAAGLGVVRLNDQHGFVHVRPGTRLEVGECLVLGISHPCTTMDKWRLVPLVDGSDRIVALAETYF